MNWRDRALGVGEGIGSFLLFSGVYNGNAPWYIGVAYATVHIPSTVDSISRIF